MKSYEDKRAEKRRLATLKQNDTEVENFPPREKGKARDIVGEKVGVSSWSVDKADNLRELSVWRKLPERTGKPRKAL